MPAPIRFYWDYTSPYAYIGAFLIDEVAAKHGRTVDWLPVSLGHLWKAIPDRAPFPKVKMDYMVHDWTRSAKIHDLPIVSIPTPFPADGKLPRLVFYHLKAQDPSKASAFAKSVFRRYWGEGRDISAPEHLASIEDIDPMTIAAAAQDPAARQAMLDATTEATVLKAFGVPTFIVDGEMFWGSDRVDHIDRWLARAG